MLADRGAPPPRTGGRGTGGGGSAVLRDRVLRPRGQHHAEHRVTHEQVAAPTKGPASALGGAAPLYLSPMTVRTSVSDVLAKPQVTDRAQAKVRARDAWLGR
jgi:hypothetical protein